MHFTTSPLAWAIAFAAVANALPNNLFGAIPFLPFALLL